VFPRDVMLEGLTDSKRLSRAARERLHAEIAVRAAHVAVGHAESQEIDRMGIGAATALAMRRAVRALDAHVEHVLVDGHPVELGVPSTAVVRGDATVRSIAAAAVYAKVTRDAIMRELDDTYPGYGFADNKGYGSAEHLLALSRLGPSAVHRRSFAPCSQMGLF
jgi:ribonuclease HII